MKNFFNPTLDEFVEEKKDLTVIGLYWAGLWRLYALVFIIAFAITFIGELMK